MGWNGYNWLSWAKAGYILGWLWNLKCIQLLWFFFLEEGDDNPLGRKYMWFSGGQMDDSSRGSVLFLQYYLSMFFLSRSKEVHCWASSAMRSHCKNEFCLMYCEYKWSFSSSWGNYNNVIPDLSLFLNSVFSDLGATRWRRATHLRL